MTMHTPTPWNIVDRSENFYDSYSYIVFHGDEPDADDQYAEGILLSDHPYYNQAPSKEDAAFIVKACNAHDWLVASLERIVLLESARINNPIATSYVLDIAEKALAKSKGDA